MKDLFGIGILILLFGGAIWMLTDGLSRKKVISDKQEASSSAVGIAFVLLGFLLMVVTFFHP